jgi:hypothetical protein
VSESTAPVAPTGPSATPAHSVLHATGDASTATPAIGGTTPATPVSTAAAPSVVATARPALFTQIATPIVSLAQAPDGDHSLTLTVSPENLGPVTVRAHISGGAIHIELHAPNDLGREALRAILVDLRRDLAAAAPHASLLLSTSDDGPAASNPQSSGGGGAAGGSSHTAGADQGRAGPGTPNGGDGTTGTAVPGGSPSADHPLSVDPTSPLTSPHGGIDIFA